MQPCCCCLSQTVRRAPLLDSCKPVANGCRLRPLMSNLLENRVIRRDGRYNGVACLDTMLALISTTDLFTGKKRRKVVVAAAAATWLDKKKGREKGFPLKRMAKKRKLTVGKCLVYVPSDSTGRPPGSPFQQATSGDSPSNLSHALHLLLFKLPHSSAMTNHSSPFHSPPPSSSSSPFGLLSSSSPSSSSSVHLPLLLLV